MDPARRSLLAGAALVGGAVLAGVGPAMCSMIGRKSGVDMFDNKPPERPAGTPQPPIDEDITPILARLDAWYAVHLDPDHYVFNPPASEDEIDAFEALVGIGLPNSYRQLYRWHNGENDDRWGHFYGLPLVSLERARLEWETWKRGVDEFGGNRYAIPGGSWPSGAVDPAYINTRWIALTIDGSGNSIGLDFDPWPNGRVGQVILFGRDEEVKPVLAPSLGKFLEWIADLLEGGNFRLGNPLGEEILREFRLKSPPVDHFHEGARKLLGAPGPYLET